MIQHLPVVLAADSALLVSAEGRMGGVQVIAVGPHAAGLDAPAHAVRRVHVARPHPRAQPEERVVGDVQRVVQVAEGRHRQHRAEDLLLEDAHAVVALEDGGLHVVSAAQLALVHPLRAAGEHAGALLLSDVDVRQDLAQLLLAGLRAEHRPRVQRVALHDQPGPGDRALHEAVVDGLVHQRAAGAGAHLTLVQREHGEAFQRLVQEVVVVRHHVAEEDVGRLAPQLQRDGDQVLGGVLHDHPPRRGLARKGDLGDARRRRQRLARLGPEALHHVHHATGKDVGDQLHQHHDGDRRLLGRLEDHAVPRC